MFQKKTFGNLFFAQNVLAPLHFNALQCKGDDHGDSFPIDLLLRNKADNLVEHIIHDSL